MPLNRQRPDETREMRLVSKVVELTEVREMSLPEFIAVRRLPGDRWSTWDELSYDLTEVIGEIVTSGTLRRWAKRYGIPETTSKDDSPKAAIAYSAALRKADIVLT